VPTDHPAVGRECHQQEDQQQLEDRRQSHPSARSANNAKDAIVISAAKTRPPPPPPPPPLPSPFVCGGTQIVRFLIAVSRQAGGTRGDKGFSMVLNTRILRACFYIAPLSSPSKIMPTPRESALRNRASPERNRKTFNQPSRDDERKSSVPACNDFSKSFATRISFAFSFK